MLLDLLLLTACALFFAGLYWYYVATVGQHDSPDGFYYQALGRRQKVPAPYSLRPMVPLLCGVSTWRWKLSTASAVTALGPLLYNYFRLSGLAPYGAVCAVSLCASLSTFVRVPALFPRLTDAPALCWLLATIGALHGCPSSSLWVVYLILGTFCSEKVPIFVALMAGQPLALFALAISGVNYMVLTDHKPTGVDWLDKPYYTTAKQAAFVFSQGVGTVLKTYLQPLGALLLALPFLEPKGFAIIFVAYLPLVRSMDYGRLVHWAGPYMALVLVQSVPVYVMPLLLAAHYFLTEKAPRC